MATVKKSTPKAAQKKNGIDEGAMKAAEKAAKNGKMPLSYYYDKEMTKRYGKGTGKNVADD